MLVISIYNLSFLGTHKKITEGVLHREPIWKYLHLYCGGKRKQVLADGVFTWPLHLLCFQISAFCYQFHSQNEKAWQVQATWETIRTYGFQITRTQSASTLEGIWLCFLCTDWNSSHKGSCINYQVNPDDWCWIGACRDANHAILTGLSSRLTKSKKPWTVLTLDI